MSLRFGVICDDLRAAPLLKALISRPSPVTLCAVRITPAADELFHGLRGVEYFDRWEDLLPDSSIADVLIGGATEEALKAARLLAQAGKSVWLLPHPQQGLMFAYEVGLQLEEGQGVIAPVFPDRALAWWQQLFAAIHDGRLGEIRYIELERFVSTSESRGVPPRSTTLSKEEGEQTGAARPGSGVSTDSVNARLLWDLDLVRRLAGRHTRVTTLRTGENSLVRQQTVTLTGDGVPETVWTIKPRTAESVDRLTLHTASGTWRVEERPGGVTRFVSEPPAELPNFPIRSDVDILFPSDITAAAWRDAVAAFELADGVEHSLERRRTIELHHEPVSERTIFKTQMTALGCAVMAATLTLVIGYVAVDSMIPLGRGARIALWSVICVPLVLFVAAQILLPLSRPSRREGIANRE